MVLLFENGFSGWGQFFQSFCWSTCEYIISLVASPLVIWQIHLCFCKSFAKIVPIQKNYISKLKTLSAKTRLKWWVVVRMGWSKKFVTRGSKSHPLFGLDWHEKIGAKKVGLAKSCIASKQNPLEITYASLKDLTNISFSSSNTQFYESRISISPI